jgi:hypothetical protein
MPLLDVTEVLTDPMFQDTTLVVRRQTTTINSDGIVTPVPSTFGFAGVVVQNSGDRLKRLEDGTRHEDSISIYTMTDLISGERGRTADIVIWQNREYTVASVLDWSTFGRGFKHAICDLRNLVPPAS